MKPTTALSRPAVLLVEDTMSLQMVYRSILATAGHRVAVAATASEGLEQFRTHRPMVVLLDLILPDRDGLEVMQEIQSIQPETRVIAITANGSV
ncbi:MAG: response regulator, partial [Pseudomonadota bacterium]